MSVGFADPTTEALHPGHSGSGSGSAWAPFAPATGAARRPPLCAFPVEPAEPAPGSAARPGGPLGSRGANAAPATTARQAPRRYRLLRCDVIAINHLPGLDARRARSAPASRRRLWGFLGAA